MVFLDSGVDFLGQLFTSQCSVIHYCFEQEEKATPLLHARVNIDFLNNMALWACQQVNKTLHPVP